MEPHPKSKQRYDEIAQWEPGTLPFSNTLGWSEWGLLGVLADFVLFFRQEGCIVEIGVGESSIYLTKLAEKYDRRIFHCDISHGVITNYKSVKGYFADNAHLFIGTSDDFFRETDIPTVALGFIDGGHMYEQVKRDFWNLFPLLVDNGYIFMHDTYPPHESWTHENACGDGYKLRQELETMRDKMDCFTFAYSAIETGLTMVRKKPRNLPGCRR